MRPQTSLQESIHVNFIRTYRGKWKRDDTIRAKESGKDRGKLKRDDTIRAEKWRLVYNRKGKVLDGNENTDGAKNR